MPSCPKNYPFYNWVPKPLGILILLLLFIPILTASRSVYGKQWRDAERAGYSVVNIFSLLVFLLL